MATLLAIVTKKSHGLRLGKRQDGNCSYCLPLAELLDKSGPSMGGTTVLPKTSRPVTLSAGVLAA